MPTRHERLFDQYVQEMHQARKSAEDWWVALIQKESRVVGKDDEAMKRVRRRWPIGPASHPLVIGVLRKYYFACHALNQEFARGPNQREDGEEEIPPEVFLTEWLLNGENDDLAEFLNTITYWPIGQDDAENPV